MAWFAIVDDCGDCDLRTLLFPLRMITTNVVMIPKLTKIINARAAESPIENPRYDIPILKCLTIYAAYAFVCYQIYLV